jgi:CRISPR-associated protein Cas1
MTEMRIKATTDGFDPMLGVLHDQRHYEKERTPSFALDLMEPLRPVVDRAVLQLVAEETFSGADFQLQSDGVCRLNPELARNVASLAIEFVDQVRTPSLNTGPRASPISSGHMK